MSSLPLLNEITNGSGVSSSKGDVTAMLCSPAILVLVVGGGLAAYNISRGHYRNVGNQMIGTIILALVVGVLCVLGLTSVSWAIVALPAVIIVSLVVIVILTLMLTSPGKRHRPHPKPRPKHHIPKEPTMSDAYKYVMTGKGFGWTGY
jgi:hypothetical protein